MVKPTCDCGQSGPLHLPTCAVIVWMRMGDGERQREERTATGEVIPIRRCARCKKDLGEPVELAHEGEVFATVNACDACVDLTRAEMATSRTIFDAMILAGVPRDVANETMTALLAKWKPKPLSPQTQHTTETKGPKR